MALSLDTRRSVPAALGSFLEREFDQSMRRLNQACGWKPQDRIEGVHEFRRSVKRLRAALQLTAGVVEKSALHSLDRALGDAARRLGSLRDAHARRIAAERVAKLLPRQWRALAMDAWRASGGSVAEAAAGLSAEAVQVLVQACRIEMDSIRKRTQAMDLRRVDAEVITAAVAHAWGRARDRFGAKWVRRDEAWLHAARKRAQRAANVLVMVSGWGGRFSREAERRLRLAAGLLGEARDAELMLERIPEQPAESVLHNVVHRVREAAQARRVKVLRQAQREGVAALRVGRGECRKNLRRMMN